MSSFDDSFAAVEYFFKSGVYPWFFAILNCLFAFIASAHAIIYKREPRAAALWVVVIWLVPFIGSLLYLLFGINRIKRKAALILGELEHYRACPHKIGLSPTELQEYLPHNSRHLAVLAKLASKVVVRPLESGNSIELLDCGDEAYPVMLDHIRKAKKSISLCTYIFDCDKIGMEFANALAEAVKNGVQVRVLVDTAGEKYSWPRITRILKKLGVTCSLFNTTTRIPGFFSINLRNHKKIMVVDGVTGFTGGMNIRDGNLLSKNPPYPVRDLHFRVTGPVVGQLQEAFVDDWYFTTGETLRGEIWFPEIKDTGSSFARGITDGPDEDFEKLRLIILGALACAQRSIKIMTPYFLPDSSIISSLNIAALKGVDVDIILPDKNNLPFVKWASVAMLWQVLEKGCRVWLSKPPFDHSKLLIVDDCWTLIGSANWDSRSLRLNFEFCLEIYDPKFACIASQVFESRKSISRLITLAEVDARPLPIRFRDGVAKLFAPYL